MYKMLLLGCISFFVLDAKAEGVATETCANGAGIIIEGAISGKRYCQSNEVMSWWNAVSWCDALGKGLFSLEECGCDWSTNCQSKCPELNVNMVSRVWTTTHKDVDSSYAVGRGGNIDQRYVLRSYSTEGWGNRALCR